VPLLFYQTLYGVVRALKNSSLYTSFCTRASLASFAVLELQEN